MEWKDMFTILSYFIPMIAMLVILTFQPLINKKSFDMLSDELYEEGMDAYGYITDYVSELKEQIDDVASEIHKIGDVCESIKNDFSDSSEDDVTCCNCCSETSNVDVITPVDNDIAFTPNENLPDHQTSLNDMRYSLHDPIHEWSQIVLVILELNGKTNLTLGRYNYIANQWYATTNAGMSPVDGEVTAWSKISVDKLFEADIRHRREKHNSVII